MSPENQGVFQLLKDGTFRRILAFYNHRKWSHFSGDLLLFYSFRLWCGSVCFRLLVGPAQELLTNLQTETSP